ncbi:MAG: cytochrome d ubiquinol oxidase subunit II [Rhabdochlamydiaceae bacterium]|nr:cytochrome d ubiquinol oxidase subunit II [Candidatus Amphrikana amoebophyrae]
MEIEVMQLLWYLVLCAAVIFYTMLDGFDLGVGALHLFAKSDTDRRVFLNSIGPIWDGNEVWLIIIGGALFAGFPPAYATIFSSFYTLLMIFLAGIIFRAVAIEFRSKHESFRWRQSWDIIFSLGSVIIAWGVGVVLGNLILGIPIDQNGVFKGTFWGMLNLYSVLVGFLGLSLFMLHGQIFLLMKTEGDLHDRIRKWIKPLMTFFIVMFVVVSLDTYHTAPHMRERFSELPWLSIVPLCMIFFIIMIPVMVKKGNDGFGFIFSSLVIISLFTLYGIGMFPAIVPSTINPEYTLTLYNSSSAYKTLEVILIIACIGVPMVLMYGFFIYHIFRGKVKIDKMSY